MNELISPSQSDNLVIVATVLVALIGGAWAFKTHGSRAAMLVVAIGVALWPLWKFHNWLTRFDPQSGYFGLESVKVLLLEAALFILIGAFFGWSWRKFILSEAEESRRQ